MRSRFGSQRRLRHAGTARVVLALALLMSAFPLLTAMQPAAAQDEEIIVGLITKTETNPFFVTMREGAQAAADAAGVTLLTGAGADVDNAGQTAALENMVAAGAQGILITPGDTKAIVPAIQKARDAGILVIALDTPTEPMEAVDAPLQPTISGRVPDRPIRQGVMGDEGTDHRHARHVPRSLGQCPAPQWIPCRLRGADEPRPPRLPT